jgi:hypothetical protein
MVQVWDAEFEKEFDPRNVFPVPLAINGFETAKLSNMFVTGDPEASAKDRTPEYTAESNMCTNNMLAFESQFLMLENVSVAPTIVCPAGS